MISFPVAVALGLAVGGLGLVIGFIFGVESTTRSDYYFSEVSELTRETKRLRFRLEKAEGHRFSLIADNVKCRLDRDKANKAVLFYKEQTQKYIDVFVKGK